MRGVLHRAHVWGPGPLGPRVAKPLPPDSSAIFFLRSSAMSAGSRGKCNGKKVREARVGADAGAAGGDDMSWGGWRARGIACLVLACLRVGAAERLSGASERGKRSATATASTIALTLFFPLAGRGEGDVGGREWERGSCTIENHGS